MTRANRDTATRFTVVQHDRLRGFIMLAAIGILNDLDSALNLWTLKGRLFDLVVT
jgi:hypothetical protein